MRNIYLIGLFIAVLFSACSVEVNETNVAGNWKASDFESTIPDVPADYAEAGVQEFLSSTYTLNPDNSFELRSNYFQQGAFGHWELNVEANEISMFYEMDSVKGVEIYTIKDLTKKKIVLFQDIPDAQAHVQITLVKE